MEINRRCCVQCDNGGAGSLDDLDAEALAVLRSAGPIEMVCEHGMDVDNCLYSTHDES